MKRENIRRAIARAVEKYLESLPDAELPNERSGLFDDFATFLGRYQDMENLH